MNRELQDSELRGIIGGSTQSFKPYVGSPDFVNKIVNTVVGLFGGK